MLFFEKFLKLNKMLLVKKKNYIYLLYPLLSLPTTVILGIGIAPILGS